MKKLAFNLFVSLCCCLTAIGLVYFVKVKPAVKPVEQPAIIAKDEIVTTNYAPEKSLAPVISNEETNVEDEPDAPNYRWDLLLTGDFHGDEVEAKSGEKWLGLFKENDRYFLRFTKIKIRRVYDDVVDYKTRNRTGKKVDVIGKNKPLFLLKHAKMLREGEIKTLFHQQLQKNEYIWEHRLENGFTKDFELNGKTYTLKVVNEKTKEKELSRGSKVILVSGDVKQILYAPKEMGEFWYFYWAGDLDSDGKLDLYLNLNDHYNITGYRLFLSSQADKGKLVKEVALFYTSGC